MVLSHENTNQTKEMMHYLFFIVRVGLFWKSISLKAIGYFHLYSSGKHLVITCPNTTIMWIYSKFLVTIWCTLPVIFTVVFFSIYYNFNATDSTVNMSRKWLWSRTVICCVCISVISWNIIGLSKKMSLFLTFLRWVLILKVYIKSSPDITINQINAIALQTLSPIIIGQLSTTLLQYIKCRLQVMIRLKGQS